MSLFLEESVDWSAVSWELSASSELFAVVSAAVCKAAVVEAAVPVEAVCLSALSAHPLKTKAPARAIARSFMDFFIMYFPPENDNVFLKIRKHS